jgi:hypothetical protein
MQQTARHAAAVRYPYGDPEISIVVPESKQIIVTQDVLEIDRHRSLLVRPSDTSLPAVP